MTSFLKYSTELADTAAKLIAPGKGILASDESNGTCGKRSVHKLFIHIYIYIYI